MTRWPTLGVMANPEPWLTVVTVVWNDAAALELTLRSTAQQRVRGVEHLIIDGDSSDGTKELALQWSAKDPRIQVLSAPDDGIYDAMNTGIAAARGRYLHFLNAGDRYIGASALATVHDQLQRQPVVWLRTPVLFVDAEGQPSRPMPFPPFDPRAFVRGSQPVYHQGAFMTRSELARLGGFRCEYTIAADYDLMQRALADGIVPDSVAEVLVEVDDAGVSTQQWPKALLDVHRSRSKAAGPASKLWSAGQTGYKLAATAGRRAARRSAERLLGDGRTSRLRGVPTARA